METVDCNGAVNGAMDQDFGTHQTRASFAWTRELGIILVWFVASEIQLSLSFVHTESKSLFLVASDPLAVG